MSSGDVLSNDGIRCLVLLVLTGVGIILSMTSLFIAVKWRALEFNRLWICRLFLLAASIGWLISLVFRLSFFWMELVQWPNASMKILCRVYSLVSMGIMEPAFYFILQLYVSQIVENGPLRQDSLYLLRRISRSAAVPVLVAVGAHVAIFILYDVLDQESALPYYYSQYYSPQDMCVVSVASGSSAALCAIIFLILFNQKLRALSVNSSNFAARTRISNITWVVNVSVITSQICRCLMVYLTSEYHNVAQILLDAHHLLILILLCGSVWVFVLHPVLASSTEPVLYRLSFERLDDEILTEPSHKSSELGHIDFS